MKTTSIFIFFEDYHHDGGDRVVSATLAEWEQLIKPAVDRRYPIDSSTVDHTLFQILYARPAVDLKLSEIKQIEHVVPLV